MNDLHSRRTLLAAAAGLAVTSQAGAAAEKAAAPRRPLDLEKPADNVLAYLKLRGSIDTQDVYFTFGGRLDLAVAGQPTRPIVNVEQLILRRTERVGELDWFVTDWEASFYRDVETNEPIIDSEIVNPVTGEKVRPLAYTEGPVRFRFTDREPRIVNTRDPLPVTGKPFHYDHYVRDGHLFMTKASYFDVPNFLDVGAFPRASSGPRIYVSSHSTLSAPLADVENPNIASVPTAFSYTALSGWLPWMHMGQTPGHVLWAESGSKVYKLEDVPAQQLAVVRQLHPQWFKRPEPWPEFTNMYLRYKALNTPKGA